MGRKRAREAVVVILYQKEIVKRDIASLTERYLQEHTWDKADVEYIRTQTNGIENNQNTIDDLIRKHLKHWDFERISKPDLAILRNAIYELFYRDDIAESVSINEAVLLCKKFGTDDASVYINGILGTIVRNRQPT